MTTPRRRYPRPIACEGDPADVDLMTAADEEKVLEFARAVPPHDLLFMRRDITQPKVVAAWIRGIERGSIVSLLARRTGRVVGCATVVRDELSWSHHVGDLRVIVASEVRGRGLGRALIQECFAMALSLGLEKLTAHATADQQGAITVFETIGFRVEALLRDHVRDRSGAAHDILVLSHDVARMQAQMQAYGLAKAF